MARFTARPLPAGAANYLAAFDAELRAARHGMTPPEALVALRRFHLAQLLAGISRTEAASTCAPSSTFASAPTSRPTAG